jgi:spore coat protein U-like protein
MRKYVLAPVAAGVLLAVAGSAQAASTSTAFTVTASVAGNCLVTATDLAFGAYVAGTAKSGQSAVKVRCTTSTPYTVDLSTGSSLSYLQRTLKNGTDSLTYNLYTDSGRTSIWGDGVTDSSNHHTGTGTGLSTLQEATFNVYGLVPDSVANQNAPPATYTDSITVSVNY